MKIEKGFYIATVIEAENGELWYSGITDDTIVHKDKANAIALKKDDKTYCFFESDLDFYRGEYVQKEVYYYDYKEKQLKKEIENIPVLFLEDPETFRDHIETEKRKTYRENTIKRAMEEIGTKWGIGKLYLNVERFNKSELGWAVLRYEVDTFQKDDTVYKVLLLHEYTTHCGNTTACFIILKEPVPNVLTLQVPQKYMGLLIGKGGENIKNVQRKYNIKIKLIPE